MPCLIEPDEFWNSMNEIQGISNQLDFICDIIDDATIDGKYKYIDSILDEAVDVSTYSYEVLIMTLSVANYKSKSRMSFYNRVWDKIEKDYNASYANKLIGGLRK